MEISTEITDKLLRQAASAYLNTSAATDERTKPLARAMVVLGHHHYREEPLSREPLDALAHFLAEAWDPTRLDEANLHTALLLETVKELANAAVNGPYGP